MANSIYNKYRNISQNIPRPPQNNIMNLISQLRQVQQNHGHILDILLESGKINQQQYQELQPYKDNPQQIYNYLCNCGNTNELNKAIQQARGLNI